MLCIFVWLFFYKQFVLIEYKVLNSKQEEANRLEFQTSLIKHYNQRKRKKINETT